MSASVLNCPHCHASASPQEAFCASCGTQLIQRAQAADLALRAAGQELGQILACNTCGAQVACQAGQRAASCAYCGSHFVVERPPSPEIPAPDFVLPFAVDQEAAGTAFEAFLKRGIFRPGDLRRAARAGKLRGIYVPFWLIDCRSESEWSASIGEYYWETETYTTTDSKGKTVTRTRRVRHTEWFPLQGRYHRRHVDVPVSASRGLPQDQADALAPFPLEAKRPYRAGYLAGWLAEDPGVGRDQAWPVAEGVIRAHDRRSIGKHLPGDTYSGLEVATAFHEVAADLALLPVWIHAYRYGKKTYPFLVNGATGQAWGRAPLSWQRILLAILLGLALVAGIVLAVQYLGALSGGEER